jgi:hypothetical protein
MDIDALHESRFPRRALAASRARTYARVRRQDQLEQPQFRHGCVPSLCCSTA